jgi:thioredoxin reductase (NADPH)
MSVGFLLDDADPALFPKLTEQQLGLLRPLASTRTTAAGEVLFADGELGYDPMVVLDGSVEVRARQAGQDRALALQLPGDLMVELNLFTGQRLAATGVVREAGAVLVIRADAFRELLGRELEFGDFVFQMLFRRRRALEELRVGIKLVGSAADRDTIRLREFAARNRILVDWSEPAGDASAKPYVLLGDGERIENPGNARLAEVVGINRAGAVPGETADLAVVGAGPGGLAAAVYAASGGLRTVILESTAVGGQASTSARIENYLGFPAGISGAELAERAALQASKFNVQVLVPREARALRQRAELYVLELDDGEALAARAVIVATGVRYRRLSAPNVEDYEGSGVAYAAATAKQQIRDGDAAVVVGGANSAGQMALALAEDGHRVHMVVRGGSLATSMAAYLRERIALDPAVQVRLHHEVRELGGDGHLERVVVEDTRSGERRELQAGAMVVLIGAVPATEWLRGELELDDGGFIVTGPALAAEILASEPWPMLGRLPLALETSRPGVFAVGDVRAGSTKMVAPAVGDGGMAVRLAAEHLAQVRAGS